MSKIAEVIIDTNSKAIDRIFDYKAKDDVKVGMRVKIPFGRGNKPTVGFVTGIKDTSEYDKLKEVIEIIDNEPIISHELIDFAKYIKKTCICNMQTALNLMLPPKTSVKFEYHIRLINYDVSDKELTEKQRIIVNSLKEKDGVSELEDLKTESGILSDAPINKLIEKNVVSKEEVRCGGAHLPKRKFVTICADNANEALSDLEGTKKAKYAFEVLIKNESMMLSELLAYASRSSIELLIKKGYAYIEEKTVVKPIYSEYEKEKPLSLSKSQQEAFGLITGCINKNTNEVFLLHGVTGSGKTEVFLQAAQECINASKKVLILVPEIALTPQMTERFMKRFGTSVALLHSGLSLAERFNEWQKIKNNEINVVVGTRSAIFAPIQNLGLIVVDEEHDSSYKSESTPKYDAVNCAIYRGIKNNCAVVLASATPKLESYYNAKSGKYTLITLNERVAAKMPDIRIVDMSRQLSGNTDSVLSDELKREIAVNLSKKEQTILFLNRRGFSTYVSYRKCGYTAKCPRCSVTLTYHSKRNKLLCHYCGYEENNINVCPTCGSLYIKYSGTGTQKIEAELKNTFEDISVIRVDADTTAKKMAHRELFNRFATENIDVMIGTQMVTKGLDFPNVTLVGVISADAVLNMDDYRASEIAFSQFTQVCGRAGRSYKPGRAIIQTLNPSNTIFELAKKQDYSAFFGDEIKVRKAFDNPPFSKLIYIIFSGDDESLTKSYAKKMCGEILRLMQNEPTLLKQYYGPAPAPIEKINNKYRYRFMLKIKNDSKILDILHEADIIHENNKSKVYMDITVSPVSMI